MSNHLENLARRLETDPFFLACPLKLYQKSAALAEDGLAAWLCCRKESLVSIRLCRAPAGEEESFLDEIGRIATRFGANRDALAQAVRLGQALFHLASGGANAGTLLAARDAESEQDAGEQKGGRP